MYFAHLLHALECVAVHASLQQRWRHALRRMGGAARATRNTGATRNTAYPYSNRVFTTESGCGREPTNLLRCFKSATVVSDFHCQHLLRSVIEGAVQAHDDEEHDDDATHTMEGGRSTFEYGKAVDRGHRELTG